MANENHDPHTGKFSSGAASGDPAKEAPATRFVPGHGRVDRSKVVAKHAGTRSVGTGGGGGGGGGGGDGSPRLSAAARDRIIRHKMIDQSHFPQRGADATAATDLGRPQVGLTASAGRFDARAMKLKTYGG